VRFINPLAIFLCEYILLYSEIKHKKKVRFINPLAIFLCEYILLYSEIKQHEYLRNHQSNVENIEEYL
jgi:hypothetical protein